MIVYVQCTTWSSLQVKGFSKYFNVRSLRGNDKNKKHGKPCFLLVIQRGFEPRTPCLKGRCSAD